MKVIKTTTSGLSKVLLPLGTTIITLILLQNVKGIRASSSESVGVPTVGLVILFSVIPHHVSGRTTPNAKDVQNPRSFRSSFQNRRAISSRSSISSEDDLLYSNFRPSSDSIKVEKIVTRSRVARQLGMIAPALQTMGCLPKFFCGMNSKAPTDKSSTLNDLAYLIKFAMVDEPDSEEIKGKDGMDSEENSEQTLSEERRQNQKFEHLADQELVNDDPEYLSFMWKDMKSKLKSKLRDDQVDDDAFEQLLNEDDKEDRNTFRLPSLFSGLTSLVRLGRSAPNSRKLNTTNFHGSRRSKSFWDNKEFDEQMKLAARIGQASTTDQKCSSTFNLCPYTIEQMKSMISGNTKAPLTSWYLNSNGPKGGPPTTSAPSPSRPAKTPVSSTQKPNQISHLIYVVNPNSASGRKPISKVTITKKPAKKPYLGGTPEPEDDEVTYDNIPLNLELPTHSVKVIKLQKQQLQQKQKHEQQAATASLEKIIDGFPTSSEENKGSKRKVPKRPIQAATTTKKPIGFPRPKYSIRNKVPQASKKVKPTKGVNKEDQSGDESAEEDLGSSQEKEEEEEEVSSEEKQTVQNKDIQSNNKQRPQHKQRFKPEGYESVESNESDEKKVPKKDKSEDEKSPDDSQQEISSEEKKSSEELEVATNRPPNHKTPQSVNNNRFNQQNRPFKDNRPTPQDNIEGSNESEDSDEAHQLKETMRPINYSYFNGKPRPTQPVNLQHRPNAFDQQQRPGYNHQGTGVNHQQNQRPKPAPTKGFFSSLFGTGNKKPNQPNPVSQLSQGRPQRPEEFNPGQNPQENRPPRPQIQYSDNHGPPQNPTNQNPRQDEDDDSEERKPQPGGPPPPQVPPVFGSNGNQGPSNNHPLQSQTGNRQPPPRIPQYYSGNPNRPKAPPPSSQYQQNPQNTRNSQQSPINFRASPPPSPKNKENEDVNDTKEDEKSDESKEDDKKSEESKESEEVGGTKGKDIFSTDSISTLGSDSSKNSRLPPPPPIANWRPEPKTTTTLKPLSKSMPTSPVFPPKPKAPSEDSKEKRPDDTREDSSEDLQIGSAPEDRSEEDKSDEGNSSEETKKPLNKKKKVEDDEAENREPPRRRFNERLPELGQVVKTSSKEFEPSDLMAPLPPVANFANKKNEIKVPLEPKPTPGTSPIKKLESTTRRPMRNPDSPKNTNSNPMSPPGGPRNPGSGMRPNSANNNNRRPGNGQTPSEENPSSEEQTNSSEETIGGSSEEEEDNSNRGRSSIEKRKSSHLSQAEDKDTLKSKDSKSVPETPQTSFKKDIKPFQKNPKPAKDSKPFKISSLGFNSGNNQFSRNTPPLPPIFKWKSQPSQTPRPKPTRRPLKQRPEFSKTLSPKMVQYLRDTYGNAVRIPDKATSTANPNTPGQNHNTGLTMKRRRRPSISYSNEGDDDEITQVGRKSSEEIDFDEFFHVGDDIGDEKLSRRQGESGDSKLVTPTTTSKPKLTLPPIYGKLRNHGRHW